MADQEGLPAYWGIETFLSDSISFALLAYQPDQEGLPAYWGIENSIVTLNNIFISQIIRKDYPLTGVLKTIHARSTLESFTGTIRKDYPLTGVLKLSFILMAQAILFPYAAIRKDYPLTGVLKPDRGDICKFP